MTDDDFTWLRGFLHGRSGLSLSVQKRYLVDSRLASVARRHDLPGIPELLRKARAGDEALRVAVVEAMATSETLFFRDATPFAQFRETMLPALMKARERERTLRIWCAAAASGQEPYSLAMILDELDAELAGWRVEILATDMSGEILAKARAGLYSQFEVQRGLPIKLLMKHFTQEGDRWRLDPRIRRMVSFRQHNLLDAEAKMGGFDIVFCRNVLIYFDVPTKSRALAHLGAALRPDGYLVLGAAETAYGLTDAVVPDPNARGLYRPAAPRLEAVPASPAGPAPRLSLVAAGAARRP